MKHVTDNVIDIERTIESALEANSVTSVVIENNAIEIKIATPRAFVRLFPKQESWNIIKENVYLDIKSYGITTRNGAYIYTAKIGNQEDFDEFCEINEYEYVENVEEENNAETL